MQFKKAGIFLISLLIVVNTSAQSNQGWFKRSWHNMNARFNGYYHAVEKLNGAQKTLMDGHRDNFNEVVTLYPYGTMEQATSVSGEMDEVFKKTSKVIKKHNRSKWVDNCYFLIGQSYFFKGDPYAAIETFQYVANQYPNGGLKYDSKIWILKSYLRQDKINDAEAILGLLKQDKDIPSRLNQEISTISAEIYIRQRKYPQAIEKLESALKTTKDKDQKYRFHFALGQMYLLTGDRDKAKEHFVRTIKHNPPYEFAFQSNLGLIQTIGYEEGGSLKIPRKYLRKMLKDDKNIDYFDQIYYELAKLELMENDREGAIDYFKKSAQASVKNEDQKASSYLQIATMYFEDRKFDLSQAYFDSTVMFISEKHPEYEKIKAQHSILTDLIDNLVTVYEQDSLLAFAELPKDDQMARIRRQMQREKEAKEKQEDFIDNSDPFNNPVKQQNNQTVAGEWYFYNASAVARGGNEFLRKWGSRPHTDFWRMQSKLDALAASAQSQDSGGDDNNDDEAEDKDALTYDAANDEEKKKFLEDVEKEMQKYFEDVPISKEAKAVSLSKIEKALFEVGKIYQYRLKEYQLAVDNYLVHQGRFPGSEFEPEIYFNLYKCYGQLGDSTAAGRCARLLNEKYRDSKFNAVVNNRNVVEDAGEEKEVIEMYSKAYDAYKADRFNEVIRIKNEATKSYPGNSLQAKFDYLCALAIGHTKGLDEYLPLLKQIVEVYPGTSIAQVAQDNIDFFEKKSAGIVDEPAGSSEFEYNADDIHFFVCIFDGGELNKVLIAFSDYNKENHRLKNLRVNDYTSGGKYIIAVQQFQNRDEVEKYYAEFLRNGKFYQDLGILAHENFMISANNFKIFLQDPESDAYSYFFVKNYIEH